MHNQRLIALLALLGLFVGFLRVQAADDVVQQIPDNALAYVVVKNMQQASREVSQTAQRMQLPALDLLQMAKQRLNLAQGVVDTGEMALVVVGREADSPFPVIFLRTDSYEVLVGQLNPDQQEDGISQVIVGGHPALVAKKGEYAVFAQPTFRAGLKQVVESEESIKTDDKVQTFAQNAEVYAVATNSGVKVLSQHALGALQMVQREFAQRGGPQAETVVAGLAVYEELFRWASEEVGQVALALQMHDNGAVSLIKRVDFQNPVEYTVRKSAASATKQFAHLPEWPYVMAMAAEIGDSKAMEKWMELSINMMRSMAGPQQLNDQQIEKLIEASRRSMQGLRGMSFVFGVPKAEGSIYSRMGAVMEVDDAEMYIDNYFEATQRMHEILADSELMPFRILAVERVQVADVQGMKVAMQVMPAAFASGDEQIKEMFDKLYGEGGKIEVYAAPVDAKRVVLAYESVESLREVMQAARSADQGLATAEGIQSTAKMLSDKAQLVCYISLEGSVQYVRRMIEMLVPQEQQGEMPQIPPFPSSPPLGLSWYYNGEALEAGLVAPAETLTGLGKYIQSIQQAAAR